MDILTIGREFSNVLDYKITDYTYLKMKTFSNVLFLLICIYLLAIIKIFNVPLLALQAISCHIKIDSNQSI